MVSVHCLDESIAMRKEQGQMVDIFSWNTYTRSEELSRDQKNARIQQLLTQADVVYDGVCNKKFLLLSNAVSSALGLVGICAVLVGLYSIITEFGVDVWSYLTPYIVGLGVFVAVVVVIVFALFVLHNSHVSFVITASTVEVIHAFIWKSRMVLPLNRIQHTASSQSIVARLLGYYTVQVACASSNLEIPGVSKEQAEQISSLLMAKVTDQSGDL